MTKRAWIGAVLLFFAWGFVIHTVGLLLHEFGGHGAAAVVFGCGTNGYDLTYFGHGIVRYATCERWSFATILVAEWAGLAVTIGAGLGVAVFVHRAELSPMARLLGAMTVYFVLLGQLGYATSGGFHDLYDPGRTARILAKHGVHVLAWLPPMVAYTTTAFLGARPLIRAFREQFGSRLRLFALAAAGILYFLAFRVEWQLRADMAMKGVAAEATRIAVATGGPPPFPIEHVLTGIAVVGLIYALTRRGELSPAKPIPRNVVVIVAASAATCFALLTALMLTRATS